MTLGQILAKARSALRSTSDTPFLDAVLILASTYGVTKEWILRSQSEELDEVVHEEFDRNVRRRKNGVPIAYITGEKEFYGIRFQVDERVLIPRPDTETLVEAGLGVDARRFLDICTGCGCVAAAVAAHKPGAEITASDVSPDALDVCRSNFESGGFGVSTVLSDGFDQIDGMFDCILSNPPYLSDKEWNNEYGDGWSEPPSALRAGVDGLDVIRRIVADSVEHLAPRGHLFVEASPHQMPAIEKMFVHAGFEAIRLCRDMGDRDRVIGGTNGTHAQGV